jgi:hypothetical protein
MKLPIPLLLYASSLGLFGFAGWTVYEMLPLWKEEVRQQAHTKGHDEANSMRMKGRQQGPQSANWVYTPSSWWEGFKKANITGKLPPAPVDPEKPKEPEKVVVVDERPLEQIIELVSLVYDGQADGKGGSTHVVVRFKPEANVQPPEWWVKENTAPPPSAMPVAPTPKDTVKQGRPSNPPVKQPSKPLPATAMPSSPLSGQVILQKLWAQDGGDARRSATLWPIKANDNREVGTIRLVRVADDAQSAFFVRELPPPKPGEPAPPPKEEELLKTAADLPQDILKEMRAMQGRSAPVASRKAGSNAPTANAWIDMRETSRVNGVFNIGTDDQSRFHDNSDRLMETLNVDIYAGRGGAKGLIVKGIDEKIGSGFGITPGDVLIEVNGRKVESKAQVRSQVEGDYNRGVRTWQTRWMSNGQIVDRTYQAPPSR